MIAASWQRSSLLSIALFASLGLNLFLAGWLLGGHPLQRAIGLSIPIDRFDEQIDTSLSPDGAQIMQRAFENIRKGFPTRSTDMRASRSRLMDVLKTEPFSVTNYLAVSKDMTTERDSDHARADEEIAAAIARLSPEDRRRLANIRQHHRLGGRGLGFLR